MVESHDHRRLLRTFYESNPLMVSSPFGGVDTLNERFLREVWGKLGIDVRHQCVLDVGCGRGLVRPVVEMEGGTYTGIDFVMSGRGFRLVQGDGHHLPFAAESFHVVFCMDAFEHFPDPGQAAREFQRVLARGGSVFLSVPNYANVAGLVKGVYEALGIYEKGTWAPFRRWQPQELEQPMTERWVRRIFRGAGFARLTRVPHGGEVGLGLCPWIDHPRMPDAIRFRAQRLSAAVGPSIARVLPSSSLHGFWKMEKD